MNTPIKIAFTTLALAIYGYASAYAFAYWEYGPDELMFPWRYEDDPILVYLFPFTGVIFGLIFSLVYLFLAHPLPYRPVKKGLLFGFLIWLLYGLDASIFSFSVYQLSIVTMAKYLIGSFIYLIPSGVIVAVIFENAEKADQITSPSSPQPSDPQQHALLNKDDDVNT